MQWCPGVLFLLRVSQCVYASLRVYSGVETELYHPTLT
jgi:hypothetical protein